MRRTRAKGAALPVKAAVALVVGVGVLALGAGRASATFTSVLYVQKTVGADTGTCTYQLTPCASITYALSQAPPGALIRVFNGVYPEQLTIAKSVTIQGSGALTTIEPSTLPATGADADNATPQSYVVGVAPGTTGVFLKNIDVSGAAAAPTFTTCTNDFVGVLFHDASGGIGAVQVSGIQLPAALATCANGVGVYVTTDAGLSADVAITHSGVRGYQKNGIECDDVGTTCLVAQSTARGIGGASAIPQNGVVIHGAAAQIIKVGVTGNSFHGGGAGNQAHGVYVVNASTLVAKQNRLWANDVNLYAGEVPALGLVPPSTGAWQIVHNGISYATDDSPAPSRGDGYGDGIVIDSTTNPVTITQNITKFNAEFGIALRGASNVNASYNTVNLDYDGIYVGGPGSADVASSANTVAINNVVNNQNVGIAADATTVESGNTFNINTANGNTLNVLDLSSGSGTSGTANTWMAQRCRNGLPSSPVGLC